MSDEMGVEGAARIARALDRIGTGDAATSMGAIEVLAREIGDGLAGVAAAIEQLAEAVEKSSEPKQ